MAQVELGDEVVPDESKILRCRHLLKQHRLSQAIFDSITGMREERRRLVRAGTIVDATVIAQPSSTSTPGRTATPSWGGTIGFLG